MQQVYDLIQLAAPSKSNILVLGESGTGKELVAKAIHHHSRRAEGPFVTVNSGSMPADLLECNLFGHVRGAFTGAVASKKGLFEVADGGSIFFDEIGNIPLDTQAKLLRVIQEKEFMRLGGVETIKVDVRIIAATNADLEGRGAAGALPRGPVLPAERHHREPAAAAQAQRGHPAARPALPRPLRAGEREGDARDLAAGHGAAARLPLAGQRPRAGERHRAGRRALDRRGARPRSCCRPPCASAASRPPTAGLPPPTLPPNGISFKDAVSQYERQIIIRALQSCGGVQKRAAELLQVKPTTLHEMMKRLNISSESLVSS